MYIYIPKYSLITIARHLIFAVFYCALYLILVFFCFYFILYSVLLFLILLVLF